MRTSRVAERLDGTATGALRHPLRHRAVRHPGRAEGVRGRARHVSSQVRMSADGLYYWDGRTWSSALSPDGRMRWDGVRWVPLASIAGPVPAPAYAAPPAAPPPKPRRVETSWTRPLQIAVGGFFALWALYSLAIPFVLFGTMTNYMRQSALRQAETMPQLYPDPNQYADSMVAIGTGALGFGAVVGIAIATVVLIGVWKRWTWMYYAVMVLLALQVLGAPYQLMVAAGLMTVSTLALPPPLAWVSGFGALLSAGVGGWMLVAVLTRGPWAMRKEVSAE